MRQDQGLHTGSGERSRGGSAGARSTTRQLAPFAALFALLAASLVGLTLVSLSLLGTLRAYEAGEGFYSKSQKDAVHHLTQYAVFGRERDWRRYRQAIAVPKADGRARRALEARPPDREAARRAFVAARNAPSDAEDMVFWFPLARRDPDLARALETWRRADALIARHEALAARIREATLADTVLPSDLERWLARLDRLNEAVTAEELAFSSALRGAETRLRRIVTAAMAVSATGLLALALAVSRAHLGRLLRSERALRRSEERFRRVVASVSDLIVVLRGDGRVLYVSDSVERILGWTPEEFVQRNVLEDIAPEDREAVAGRLARAQAEPGRVLEADFRARHRDGSWRVFESTGAALQDEDGQAGHVVSVSRDVTDRLRMEEELRQSQKLESLGRLAGGVAHDFNNLLTVILGEAEYLEGKLPPASALRPGVRQVLSSAERAAELTAQLLAFARRQVIAPRLVDLGETLRGLEPMARRLVGEDVELRVDGGEEPLPVLVDGGQVEQLVVNLVANARDAMPRGGRLDLSARPVHVGEHEEVPPGNWVRLAVRDTGRGIPAEDRERIFEPFFTTKPVGEGTGLGLASSYGIVQQSRGHIRVDSDPAAGTEFRIYLPRAVGSAEAAAAGPRQRSEAAPDRGAETVLVVEDEADVRRLAVRALEALGYRVWEAEDGQKALDLVLAGCGPFQLLLTDLVMPQLGGARLAARLRALTPGLRVVFMTGYADVGTLDEALPEGADAVLPKPFTARELGLRVREVLDAPAPQTV